MTLSLCRITYLQKWGKEFIPYNVEYKNSILVKLSNTIFYALNIVFNLKIDVFIGDLHEKTGVSG